MRQVDRLAAVCRARARILTPRHRWVWGSGAATVALLLALGCGSPQAPEQAERWATAWIESLNSHRVEQVATLMDKAATYEDPMTRQPLSDAALAFFLASVWQRFPQCRYELRGVHANGNLLSVDWSATHLGAAPGSLEGEFLIQLNGDHIASVRSSYHNR